MKYFFLLVICCTLVCAADVSVTPLELNITPGTQITFDISAAPGIQIKEIKVDGCSHFYKTLLENGLNKKFSMPVLEEHTLATIKIPEAIPAARTTARITIFYNDQEKEFKLPLKADGNWATTAALWMLPDSTVEAIMAQMEIIQSERTDWLANLLKHIFKY